MAEILIIALLVFVVGAILLLERQSLGKLAFVQPMVLCLLAGIILKQPGIAIWLGISLQLLSVGQGRYCNWALVGVITASTLLLLGYYDISIVPGSVESIVLLIVSILFGIQSDAFIRMMVRKYAVPLRSNPLWHNAKSFNDFSRIIYKSMLRGLIAGGVESLMGVTVASLLTYGSYAKVHVNPLVSSTVIVVVPLFGVSVALGAMSRKRYPVMAAVGVVIFFAMVAVQ
jgi:hypothetical protein